MRQRIRTALVATAGLAVVAGGVLVPAAAFAAVSDTKNTTVNANIGSTISINSTSGTVNLAITPTGSGSASSASDTVSVSTNNALGYTLQLASSTAQTSLNNGGNTIPASAGTQGTPITLANNSWGYRVDSIGGFGAGPTSAQTNQSSLSGSWAGVPATSSPNTIRTTNTTATNETTTVWYGAKADTSKPNGTYSDIITYTATTQ